MNVAYGLWTEAGPVRRFNEDFAAADAQAGVFVVADGSGGIHSGALAAAVVGTAVLEGLVERLGRGTDALPEAFAAAAGTWDKVAAALDARGAGCTCAALWLVGAEARVAHLGDCRVWRVRSGVAERLTTDHTLAAQQVARGQLAPADAEGHPWAHIVTRSVSVGSTAAVDVAVYPAAPGDTFVLCTDGAARLDGEALAKVCVRPAPLAARRLVELALAQDGEDNVAAIVVQLTG